MPYPILKLPYGLQQRLRNLASPKERYNLQVAIGFEKNYLRPLQMCIKDYLYNDFRLIVDYKDFILKGDDGMRRDCEGDNLFLLESTLRLPHLEPDNYDSPFFDHLLVKCKSLLMANVSPKVLYKLSKLCDPKLVNTFHAHMCCPDFTLRLLIEKFSYLKRINIVSPAYKSNWIHDMLNFKNLKLIRLYIQSQFEKLFCFELHELAQLYKSLPSNFLLTLDCQKPPENAHELIRHKLGPHFKKRPGGAPFAGVNVLIILRSPVDSDNYVLSNWSIDHTMTF